MSKFVPEVSFEQMTRAVMVSQGQAIWQGAIAQEFGHSLPLMQAVSDRMMALQLLLAYHRQMLKDMGIPDHAMIQAAASYPLSQEFENPLMNNTPAFDPEKFVKLAQKFIK